MQVSDEEEIKDDYVCCNTIILFTKTMYDISYVSRAFLTFLMLMFMSRVLVPKKGIPPP